MRKSVKQEEFDKFRRAINISIDSLNKRMRDIDRVPDGVASRKDLYSQVKLANAKFDAIEQAIDLIFSVLESHDLNIKTCTHCKQPLPKANNDN